MSEETNITTTEATPALTADQLLALSAADWEKAKAEFEAAIKAKAAEEKAAVKAKIVEVLDKIKTYGLPVIKYVAGVAVVLKVFGVI